MKKLLTKFIKILNIVFLRLPKFILYLLGCIYIMLLLCLGIFTLYSLIFISIIIVDPFNEKLSTYLCIKLYILIEILKNKSTYEWNLPYSRSNPPTSKKRIYYKSPFHFLLNKKEEEIFYPN